MNNFTGGAASTKLQVASIRIKDHEKCAQAYTSQKNSRIDEKVLCAGEQGVDTCQVLYDVIVIKYTLLFLVHHSVKIAFILISINSKLY